MRIFCKIILFSFSFSFSFIFLIFLFVLFCSRGVLGIAGTTAYFGFFDIGKPKAGETVVVSAAAGSVGEIVV